MHDLAVVASVISGLWLLGWAVFAFWRIINADTRPTLYLILVQFLFAGAPIWMDLALGPPTYTLFPAVRRAVADDSTTLLYLVYMSLCPPIWWWMAKRPNARFCQEYCSQSTLADRVVTWVLHLAVISPVLAVAFAPAPSAYLSYGLPVGDWTDMEVRQFHSNVADATMVAGLACMSLLMRTSSNWATRVYAVAGCFAAVWLNGKRYIVAMIITWALAVFCCRPGWKRGSKMLVTTAGITLIAGFSLFYQLNLRDIDSTTAGYLYESYRIDFGRDHGIKLALHKELDESERPLLEYRGQSVLFALTFWVPRSWWPEKPYPYYIYYTGALLDVPTRYSWLGWGITNSWLDEAVANFGLFGIILGVLLPGVVCRGGQNGSPELWLTTVTIGFCLMTSDVAGWTPILIPGIFFYFASRLGSQPLARRTQPAQADDQYGPLAILPGIPAIIVPPCPSSQS